MNQSLSRKGLFSEAGAIPAPKAREDELCREGHMGAIRFFVVLSWAVFAVRQIFIRPVEALVTRDRSR